MPVKQNRLYPGSQHLKLYQKKLSHILLKGKYYSSLIGKWFTPKKAFNISTVSFHWYFYCYFNQNLNCGRSWKSFLVRDRILKKITLWMILILHYQHPKSCKLKLFSSERGHFLNGYAWEWVTDYSNLLFLISYYTHICIVFYTSAS